MMGVDVRTMGRLLVLRDVVGPIYGSEHLSMLLYTMVRRERPKVVVELGTGLGVSTFWIAQALKENGTGHLWTVEDGSQLGSDELARQLAPLLEHEEFQDLQGAMSSHHDFFRGMVRLLRLGGRITLVQRHLDLPRLADRGIGELPFGGEQIDMLFSDFHHGPEDIMDLLTAFLPNLASSASIFIDSASTHWVSYLTLERLMEQLRGSKIPRRFLAASEERVNELVQLVLSRSFSVTHMVERMDRDQNSTAWIKVEPSDYVPYPATRMHPS